MTEISKKEIINSLTKSAFSMIPFAGQALNELVFEYNGRLKQKRLNNFIEVLADYFEQNNDINIKNIKTDDFNDLFESILRKVVTTKSEFKLKRFKKILVKELNNPSKETELISLYLDLISSLSEEELRVLYNHRHFDRIYENEQLRRAELYQNMNNSSMDKKQEIDKLGREIYKNSKESFKDEISRITHKHKYLKKYRRAESHKLDEQKFLFYKQRLFSKGLLTDHGVGKYNFVPFDLMQITEFGKRFIEFLKS